MTGGTTMEEQDYNGQKRQQKPDQPAAVDVLGLAAVIVICLGTPILIAGLVAALDSSYKVGAYASYGGGLTAIAVASVMVSGGVALLCHRLHVKSIAKLRAEIRELSRNCRSVIALLAERNTSDADQVGAARRGHEN